MFVDLVSITVESGKGGDGTVAFRREAFVPKGGPDGGDGGRGGHVILEGDEGLSTLLDLRYKKHFKAFPGGNGLSKKRHGKNGEDAIILVPLGTQVFDPQGLLVCDIKEHKEQFTLIEGGRGGRGNVKFMNARNNAPKIAEKGEPGKIVDFTFELKLLADVGLIGLPSVGKSTLISVISAVKPKIADYPFTTLVPNLGVVSVPNGHSFVVADMPGLIEGAALGQGLGHQFLRHIERTRVLVHVLDMAPLDESDPYQAYQTIYKELKAYNEDLANRPMVIAANKMDIEGSEERLEAFKKKVKDIPIIPISAYQKTNLDELLYAIDSLLIAHPIVENKPDDFKHYKFDPKEDIPFEIRLGDDGVYEVDGGELQRIFQMTVFEHDQAVKRFARQLRFLGVDEALREKGVKHGETVRICGSNFEFVD
jgi:GTP-binding protein